MTNRYLVGPNVDEILADENGSGTVTWSLAENLGSVRDLVQYTSGTNTTTVVNHVVYDTFGQIKSQTNTTWQPLFAYTGREWDADAGLYYYRARWYDARVGRFLSEDPLGFAVGDVNLSRYVANSATMFVDPSGMNGDTPYSVDGFTYDTYAEFLTSGVGTTSGIANQGALGRLFNSLTDAAEREFQTLRGAAADPFAVASGAATGVSHGGAMVVNAATAGLIPELDQHVQDLIAENGGAYGAANLGAQIGVEAGKMAIGQSNPCGYVAKAISFVDTVASGRDLVEGVQEGDPLKVLTGATGVIGGVGGMSKNCFVAGTQVVVGVWFVRAEPSDSHVEESASPPWATLAMAVAAAVVLTGGNRSESRRKRRRRPGGMANESRDRREPKSNRHWIEPNDDRRSMDSTSGFSVSGEPNAGRHGNSCADQTGDRESTIATTPRDTSNEETPLKTTSLAGSSTIERSRDRTDRRPLVAALVACLALMTVFFTGGGNQSPRATTAGMMTPGAADSEIRFETKNIEDLVVGEQVLAWNEQTGEQALKPIEETFRRQSTHLRVLRIETVDGEQQTLQTTDEHPFWTENRGWVEAGDLTSDDTLRDAIGRPARLASTDREDLPTSVAVFNMRVADWHTYFALEYGSLPVLVHNADASDYIPQRPRGRMKGDRMKSGDDALRQWEEIEEAQRKVRQGKSDKIIDSIEKSKQRAKNRLKDIRDLGDLEDLE